MHLIIDTKVWLDLVRFQGCTVRAFLARPEDFNYFAIYCISLKGRWAGRDALFRAGSRERESGWQSRCSPRHQRSSRSPAPRRVLSAASWYLHYGTDGGAPTRDPGLSKSWASRKGASQKLVPRGGSHGPMEMCPSSEPASRVSMIEIPQPWEVKRTPGAGGTATQRQETRLSQSGVLSQQDPAGAAHSRGGSLEAAHCPSTLTGKLISAYV